MSHSARVYQQQPSATNGMVVAPGGGGNRNAKNMPVDADGREWSHGLFGCMSACGTCMLSLIGIDRMLIYLSSNRPLRDMLPLRRLRQEQAPLRALELQRSS
jgi:hypothetical protein